MKNLINRIILIVIVMTSFSCSDFLQYDQKGEPTNTTFWKTEVDAQRAADGLYYFMGEAGISGRGFMHYYNCSDDVVTGRAQGGTDKMKNFIADFTRDVTQNWPIMYRIIRRANEMILNIPKMEISETVKNRTLGEAYFMRAWAYLWLAPYYGDNGENGGIPIVAEDLTMEELDVPRPKTVSENYEYCIADFERAASMLPYLDEMSLNDYGRPHKTACWAYMAKAALYNARYDNAFYKKVIEYSDKVINSNKHKLHPDFASLFTAENNYSKEYLFSFASNAESGSMLPGVMFENKGWGLYNGWGYFTPTLSLVEAYEEGDKRLPATVMQPGDVFTYLGSEKVYYSSESYSGMMFSKYCSPFKDYDAVGKSLNPDGDNPTTNLNIPLIRYAEVLLFKAEAMIWTGANGDEEINLVRARAGLPPLTNATKADLKRERRCEFAGEFVNRTLDLIRWGDADVECEKPLYGYKAVPKEGVNEVKSKEDLDIQVVQIWGKRNYDPSVNHVFPIPENEIAKGENLKQNKGY